MLGHLGFEPNRENVAILVGPNGSGKSNFLKALVQDLRGFRDLAVVCNTAYDRFAGMRGIHRMSAGRAGQSPKTVVKRAVARTLEADDSRYFQTGAILEYCGYAARFGFRTERPRRPPEAMPFDDLDLVHGPPAAPDPDFMLALEYLGGFPDDIIWVDQHDRSVSGFRARDFSAVLRNEERLRRSRHLKDISVFLDKKGHGPVEIHHASSGELSLISSLVFLISLPLHAPVILVDEPENSLHPTWQREYLDKILAAMAYRDASVVIATHAPLIVTGALAEHADLVSVFQIQDGVPQRLPLSAGPDSADSIEAVLYRAFDVITPASHFVSQQVQSVVARLEQGELGTEDALAIVDEMDRSSFDDRQHRFFSAIREVITNVPPPTPGAPGTDG